MFLQYEEGLESEARALARKLQIECYPASYKNDEETLFLVLEGKGLSLRQGNLSMMGDFEEMIPRLKQSNLEHEMLVKAARIKGEDPRSLQILDATEGMGEDSLILSAAGFNVLMYEYDAIIAELLIDTIKRAMNEDALKEIVSRMEAHSGDSIKVMSTASEADKKVDIILLDPMFPERKKSGLIKKKFQLLQQLECPCSNEEELFAAAKAANPRKIIVKRPAKGPFLAGAKPSYSVPGKAIRYDCYI